MFVLGASACFYSVYTPRHSTYKAATLLQLARASCNVPPTERRAGVDLYASRNGYAMHRTQVTKLVTQAERRSHYDHEVSNEVESKGQISAAYTLGKTG